VTVLRLGDYLDGRHLLASPVNPGCLFQEGSQGLLGNGGKLIVRSQEFYEFIRNRRGITRADDYESRC
jgi:hypothetical protein